MPLYLEIGGFRIAEPATMLTDYVMGGVAAGFAVNLWRSGRIWWAGAFGAFAVSSFLGGTWHGFQLELAPHVAAGLWRFTVVSALVSACLLIVASALLLGYVSRRTVIAFALLKLIVVIVWVWPEPAFIKVLIDFCVSFCVVLGIAVMRAKAVPGFGSRLVAATAFFTVGGILQVLELSPHPWFNHNDLFHVIQIAGNTCMFLAAKRTPPVVSPRRE